MVVVDKVDKSNENVNINKSEVIKCEKEMKILNSDCATCSLDDLTKGMKGLAVDPAELQKEFISLSLQEKEDESDDSDVIVYGDHRDDEVELIGRGPPGIPTESLYYSQMNNTRVGYLVDSIQRSRAGGKRPHDEPIDPLSKGFKPQDLQPHEIRDINTVERNQLSGGSVKCGHQRTGKPTVKQLLAEKEQREKEELQKQMQQLQQPQSQQFYMVQQQYSAMMQQVTQQQSANEMAPHQLLPSNATGMNIPPDPLFLNDDEDEGIPSFDMNAALDLIRESEILTQEELAVELSAPIPQTTTNQPTVLPAPETQLRHEGIRRVRNEPSMSESSVSDPRSPESGYQTSSSAPGSPKSPSSRPSSFDEDQKLAPEMEERLSLFEEWMQEKEEKYKNTSNKVQEPQSQQPSWQPAQSAQGPTTIHPVAQPAYMAPPPPPIPQQPAPMIIVGVPNIIPRHVAPAAASGKGRPPNSSKGRQPSQVRQRAILPKPATPVQTIPTTVTASQTSNVNSGQFSVVQGASSQSSGQVIYQQQQCQSRTEPTKLTPIAPKKEDPQSSQRGIFIFISMSVTSMHLSLENDGRSSDHLHRSLIYDITLYYYIVLHSDHVNNLNLMSAQDS